MSQASRALSALAAVIGLALASDLAAEDWPRFRGPNGSGLSAAADLPVEIGEATQVWQAEVPFGRSSPVIAGQRIYLTAVEGELLVTLGLDRETGRTVWRRSLERARQADLYQDTDSSTPTPVSDGEHVYAFFQEAGLVSYDAEGQERWRLALGPFRNYYGIASSPVLAGDLLLLLCDQAEGSFLLAVEKDSGKVRWRRNRPARLESYSTPILHPAVDPEVVVISGSRWVDAYDLRTGESAWSLPGVGSGPVSSPVIADGMLFINAHDHADGGWPEFAALAQEHDADGNGELSPQEVAGAWLANHFGWLDTDASGALTPADWKVLRSELVNENWGAHGIRLPAEGGDAQPRIVWSYRKNIPYIPSPVVYDGVFYMVKDGVMTSLDAATGALLKRERLGEAKGKVYASPVAADGKIYVATLDGSVAVVEAGKEWKVLATHDLGEAIWASPAIADGHLYLRTEKRLLRFGKPKRMPAAEAAAGR